MPYCQGITQCKNDGCLSPACQYEPAQCMCVLRNRTPTMEVLVVGKLPSHASPGLPMLGNSPNIIGKGKPFWGGRFNHLEKNRHIKVYGDRLCCFLDHIVLIIVTKIYWLNMIFKKHSLNVPPQT